MKDVAIASAGQPRIKGLDSYSYLGVILPNSNSLLNLVAKIVVGV